jgi:hypothetical protein
MCWSVMWACPFLLMAGTTYRQAAGRELHVQKYSRLAPGLGLRLHKAA